MISTQRTAPGKRFGRQVPFGLFTKVTGADNTTGNGRGVRHGPAVPDWWSCQRTVTGTVRAALSTARHPQSRNVQGDRWGRVTVRRRARRPVWAYKVTTHCQEPACQIPTITIKQTAAAPNACNKVANCYGSYRFKGAGSLELPDLQMARPFAARTVNCIILAVQQTEPINKRRPVATPCPFAYIDIAPSMKMKSVRRQRPCLLN